MSRWVAVVKHEVAEVAGVTAYFLVAFGIVGLLAQLFVAEYGVSLGGATRVVIGALVVAKVVVVLDKTRIGRGTSRRSVAMAVLFRAAVYSAFVVVVAVAEALFHGVREAGTFAGGVETAFHEAAVSRGAARLILVFLSFVGYFLAAAVVEACGRERIRRFLFDVPPPP